MAPFVWNVRPELMTLGPFEIRWYGLFFACAFLFGLLYTSHRSPRAGLSINTDALLLYLMVGTLTGARLAHCLFYDPGYYFSHPLKILMVWQGGLASHGGLLGFLLALWLFTRKWKVPFLPLLDLLAPPAAIGGALVRLGNFFNSEIVGHSSNLPWAVVFSRVDSLPRHPVQLYEAMAYTGVFLLLLVMDWAGVSKRRGLLSGFFLIAVFSSRFALEFFKLRQAAWASDVPLSMGQVLSLPMILAGFLLVVLALSSSRLRGNA